MKAFLVLFCITFLAVHAEYKLETTTSTTPPPQQNSSSVTAARFGKATFYDITVGFTACGTKEKATDFIVAVAKDLWKSTNPNNDPLCQRSVTITNPRTGTTITCKIKDKCPSCQPDHLDLTTGAFLALGEDLDKGVFPITWDFI